MRSGMTRLGKIAVVGVALLLVTAAGSAATTLGGTSSDGDTSAIRDVDVTASYDDGTVTLTVTADGSGVEDVAAYVGETRVGTTGADGTVTFETNATEELEVDLRKGAFDGELKYTIHDGSLVTIKESFEYAELDDDGEPEDEVEDEGGAEDEFDQADENGDEADDDGIEDEDEQADEDEDEFEDADD